MALSASFSSGGKSTRWSSPWLRRCAGRAVESCAFGAFFSNGGLKNASILAIQGFWVSKSVADPFGPHHEVTRVATILRQEVEQAGILSFARFMEVALYCPKIGYYEGHTGQMGRAGDYYTSISVGPLFGELLARRFADWLEELSPGPLQLAEAGAHDGQLAHDILSWLAAHRPQLFARIQ